MLAEFESDGCSGGMSKWWKKIFKELPPWEGCCIRHDLEYWIGGSKKDRLRADINLFVGVAVKGYPIIGFLMFIAVRLFGGPLWPSSYRWGYGYKYLSTYAKYSKRFYSQCMALKAQKRIENWGRPRK